MENKNKYLWILALVSLGWGTAAFNSYADNKEKAGGDKKKVTVLKKETVIIENNGNKKGEAKEVKKEKPAVKKEKTKGKTKEREVKVREEKVERPLAKHTSEEAKYSADVTFGAAYNMGYIKSDNFDPALIHTKKSDSEESMNPFDLSMNVKLNVKKKFFFDNYHVDTALGLKATQEKVKLTKIYLMWGEWTMGLTGNNFANISTGGSTSAILLAWKRDINEQFTVGVDIERAEDFSFYGTADEFKKKRDNYAGKPMKHGPAGSVRVEYHLPNKLGSVELSGLIRSLGWYNKKTDKTTTDGRPGYGFNLGSKLQLRPEETGVLTVNVMFGDGIGEYLTGLSSIENEPITIYPKDDKTSALSPAVSVKAGGLYASYEHHYYSFLRSTFGAGITQVFGDNKQDRPESYKLGGYLSGNLAYWFTEHTAVALEYGTGFRNNADNSPSKQDSKGANYLKATFEFKI